MSRFLTELQYLETEGDGEWRTFYALAEPLRYRSDILEALDSKAFPDGVVEVPTFFVTDFATVPFPLSLAFRPIGPWKRASVVHDYLCKEAAGRSAKRFPGLTRKVADDVFYEAMRVEGVNAVVARTMWLYVRALSVTIKRGK